MKYRTLICATLMVCIPSLSIACGSASREHFGQDQRLSLSELEDVQIEYLARTLEIARDDLVLYPGGAFVRHVDLDGDGTAEICVSLQTTATCSNGVGVCLVLVLKDWSTEPLLEFWGHLLVAEQLQEERWARLVGVSAYSDGTIRRMYYELDNGIYSAELPTEIGSWAEERCHAGEYEPRMLCSPILIEALRQGI